MQSADGATQAESEESREDASFVADQGHFLYTRPIVQTVIGILNRANPAPSEREVRTDPGPSRLATPRAYVELMYQPHALRPPAASRHVHYRFTALLILLPCTTHFCVSV